MHPRLPGLLVIALLESSSALADAPVVSSLKLSALPADAELAQLLWDRAPELEAARAKVNAARADLDRAHLLPNPGLDLSWNTIPVGETNPVGLSSPLNEVPNYAIAISTLVELGKRGPRQDAAAQTLRSAALDALEALRQRWFDLHQNVAEVAATEVRLAELTELAADAARLTELQRQRAQKGDTAGLDADRTELEELKLQSSLGEEHAHLSQALRTCGQLAGVRCEPFDSREAASRFLGRTVTATASPLDERPDLRSLSAQEAAATSTGELARARAIPDPSVRAGFVRDLFVVSGNQPNSLFVGLSFPLPVFDHGQADAQAASAAARSAARSRELLVDQARRDLGRIDDQIRDLEDKRSRLREKTLPLARAVVTRLEVAMKQGGASLQDLLLARRTLGELLMDAGDLDLTAFRLRVERERTGGSRPPSPPGA